MWSTYYHNVRTSWNRWVTSPRFIGFVYAYHLLFILVAYLYRTQRGISDAHTFWGLKGNLLEQPWFSYLSFGNDFMLFLTYPFVWLGLPFWFGFWLFGTIGFVGIVYWMRWLRLELGGDLTVKGWSVLPFLFFWPNLHFWTAGLGKESLVFWSLAVLFYTVFQRKFGVLFWVAGVLLVVLRPHVAMFFAAAFLLGQLLQRDVAWRVKMKVVAVSAPLAVALLYVVLKMTNIRYIDWKRIQRFNDFSVRSFEGSGSYVPMLDYSWGYKMVSLSFRPFLWEATSFFSFLAGLNNFIELLCHGVGLVLFVVYFRRISFSTTLKVALLFAFISASVYVFRYANFGIFMRTKMMWLPFLAGVFVFILRKVENWERG